MFSTIRRQLIIGFIGLAITPLLLAGLVSSSASFRAQEQQALILQQELAQRFSAEINQRIGQIENEMRQLTRVGNFTQLSLDAQTERLNELLSYQDGLESLALLDADGQEVTRVERMRFVDESDLRDWSQTDEFRISIAEQRPYYGALDYEEATEEPLMNLAYPLLDLRTLEARGVLIGEIRFRAVWDLLQESGVDGIYVLNEANEGRVIAHARPSIVLSETIFTRPEAFGVTAGLNGQNVVMAWEPLRLGGVTETDDDPSLFVVAEQPVSQALELAYNSLNVTIGLLAGALVVACTTGVVAVRQIVWPIETLAATAQKIAAGDLSQQAEVESAAEIEALAESFNTMTSQLMTTMGGLEMLNADLERRVAERTAQLEAANLRLTELDRLKTLFIQDMSHELRTPLTVLGTSVYLLERKPEQSAEYLQKLKDQIAKLTHLANSAIEIARLDADPKEWVFAPVSLNEIVGQVAAKLTDRAEKAGLAFVVQPDAQLAAVHGERDQLAQVVTHLVTNAINYTQAGSVEVTTRAENGRACLEVRDTGRGIVPEDIPHLFERFYRGTGVGSSTISGSGLGLAIVKRIVDLHEGSIEVESMVEAGTTFRVWLPLAKRELKVKS